LDIDFHFEKSGEPCSQKQTGEDKRASDNCRCMPFKIRQVLFAEQNEWRSENVHEIIIEKQAEKPND
jgi:hypothetical protein